MKTAMFLLTVTLLVQLIAESSSDAYTLEPISGCSRPLDRKQPSRSRSSTTVQSGSR